jgi:hypothetical protein
MLTVGGLLLGAVLTAPVAASGAAPTDPFAPTKARVSTAHDEAALDLRDPFAPEPAHLVAAATHRRPARPSDVDLRDPFAAARPLRPSAPPAPPKTGSDLHAPFDPSTRVTAPARPSALRDPFHR